MSMGLHLVYGYAQSSQYLWIQQTGQLGGKRDINGDIIDTTISASDVKYMKESVKEKARGVSEMLLDTTTH